MTKFRHAIVVGASSGVGAELVRQLASSGCRVAAVARRKDRLDRLAAEFPGRDLALEATVARPDGIADRAADRSAAALGSQESGQVYAFVADVTRPEGIAELFAEMTGAIGGLDLFVYVAGAMPTVGLNEFDTAKDRSMIDVNVAGAVAWLNRAAERMQATRHGTLVAIGSVAGDRGRRGQPVYNASKAFLHTYMEALRNRLSRHGVTVTTIKPGPMATEMTAGLRLKSPMSAAEAARRILQAAPKGGERYLKLTHRLAFAAIRHIPSWIFRRLSL